MADDEREEDDLSRQKTVLAHADQMAREHSARREIRLREERVRRLTKDETSRRRRPASEEKPASKEESPRLSDPFPPLQPKKKRPAEKPPTHSGPHKQIGPAPKAGDQLAVEVEELLRRFRLGWRALRGGDKITVGSAVMVIAGVLMPWVTTPGRPLEPGLFVGGLVHLGLAVAALHFVTRGFAAELAHSAAELARRRARHSLYIVLLGALSTFFGAYLLLWWGAQKSPGHPVELHFGFYWTLACGTGLSYGGFARFGAGGPR